MMDPHKRNSTSNHFPTSRHVHNKSARLAVRSSLKRASPGQLTAAAWLCAVKSGQGLGGAGGHAERRVHAGPPVAHVDARGVVQVGQRGAGGRARDGLHLVLDRVWTQPPLATEAQEA